MNERDKKRIKRYIPFLLLTVAAVLLIIYFKSVAAAVGAV